MVKVHTLAKTSLVENFKHGWRKNGMDVNMATLSAREFFTDEVSWFPENSNLKTLLVFHLVR